MKLGIYRRTLNKTVFKHFCYVVKKVKESWRVLEWALERREFYSEYSYNFNWMQNFGYLKYYNGNQKPNFSIISF